MKIVFNRTNSNKRYITPVIGYERPATRELKKSEYLVFKLKANPNAEEAQAATYDLSLAYFNNGTPEELLTFLQDLNKVIVGQNLNAGPPRYALARRCLKGDALAAFNRAATANGNETVEHFKLCLRELIKHVFPRRALATQKRYMRRFLCKPRTDSIRDFMTRLTELNEYLEEFPDFNPNQKLPDDEIMDIAEFTVSHNVLEFVEFCERLEFYEGSKEENPQTDSKNGNNGEKSRAKSSARGNNNNNNNNKNKKRKIDDDFCALHQTHGHSTGECKVLLDQAKKMRASWDTAKGHSYTTKPNRNWRNNDPKDNTKKPFQKKESLFYEAAKEALKEVLATENIKAEEPKEAEVNNSNNNTNNEVTIDDFENLSLSENEN